MCRRKLIRASEDIITGARIIEVALGYGWQSHSRFTKAFKKRIIIYNQTAFIAEIKKAGENQMGSLVFFVAAGRFTLCRPGAECFADGVIDLEVCMGIPACFGFID